MYGTGNASKFIILMARCVSSLDIQCAMQGALHAMDLARYAMWNSLICSICKLTILFLLGSHSKFGIMGVAIAMSVGVILITLLHIVTLNKMIQFIIPIKDLMKMLLLVAMTTTVGYFLKEIYALSTESLWLFLCILFILTSLYILFLLILKFITKEELQQIPFIRKWLYR